MDLESIKIWISKPAFEGVDIGEEAHQTEGKRERGVSDTVNIQYECLYIMLKLKLRLLAGDSSDFI